MLDPFQPAGSLFEPPSAPYQPASSTSRRAAKRVRNAAGTIASRILAELRCQGTFGATDEELEHALGTPGNSIRPRRRSLELAGLIVDSGRTRNTQSGSAATVWVLVKIEAAK